MRQLQSTSVRWFRHARVFHFSAYLAVALAAALPSMPAIDAYFTGDDFALIQLFAEKPPLHFVSLFGKSWTELTFGFILDELRPLVALSYQIDANWGPALPAGYHTTNIMLHVANALLVTFIARNIAQTSTLGAISAGILFALLPSNASAVVWISGRADTIPTLLYSGAFTCFALWRRTQRLVLYMVALTLCILALWSKQSAITYIASIVLYDIIIDRKPSILTWRSLAAYIPFIAATFFIYP